MTNKNKPKVYSNILFKRNTKLDLVNKEKSPQKKTHTATEEKLR